MIKVLNLYSGIGGNRRLWENVKVTAVELDFKIAAIYKDFFPNDEIIVGDAHKYLLENYDKFDFIWSSPPCPTHSRIRIANQKQNKPIYPDMTLYQEIIFLKQFFKGKWVVENVKSYYKPLIKPQEIGRHYLWSNFFISNKNTETDIGGNKTNSNIKFIAKRKGLDYDFKHPNKLKLIRNAVDAKIGLFVLNQAFKTKQKTIGDDWR